MSFDCDNATPQQAMADLGKVLGFPIDGLPDAPANRKGKESVTLHAKDQPLWAVVGELCKQARLEINPASQFARRQVDQADARFDHLLARI